MTLDELAKLCDEANVDRWSAVGNTLYIDRHINVPMLGLQISLRFIIAAAKNLPELVRRLMRLRELLPVEPVIDGLEGMGGVLTGPQYCSHGQWLELRELIHGDLP